jgi:outer membrane protein TolC
MNRSVSITFTGLLIGLVLTTTVSTAQVNPAGKPRTTNLPTNPLYHPPPTEIPDSVIENRLVQLALNSPTYDASNHQNRINELALRSAKSSWLNLLTISTSYYDQSAAKSTGSNTYVVPKYFFTLSIPLGIIFSQGTQIKTARESLALTRDRQADLARNIKADILGKYLQYKLNNTLIQIQNEMLTDVTVGAGQVEDNFKKGAISVEAYISSQRTRNDEVIKSLNLKLQQDLLTLEIEKIIGVPVSQVLAPAPLPKSRP